MSDDLSLDNDTLDAQLKERQPADPWLERRRMTFGASEVPALLHGYGKRPFSEVFMDPPGYLADKSNEFIAPFDAGGGIELRHFPRLVLEKAGVKAPLKAGRAAAAGNRRERELLLAWKRMLESGQFGNAAEQLIDTSTIRHADAAPKEWFPLIDRECPHIGVTPDAWCRDINGELVGIELKCSTYSEDVLPWWWDDQKQTQLAACAESWGLVVQGVNWSAHWLKDGPVRSWVVNRDEAVISEIRDVCRVAWGHVEAIRKAVAK